ncbi:MAG TPA: NCS1 family nucleobase:cation symporter-1 [Candidatus Limnocylindria bacterium]|nr:NCS1 family nucleobase:cation symporter-1 [Candidatus Limnocylindria bacterium]
MTAAAYEETVHPDGRHELTPAAQAALDDSPIYNEDLAPVRIEQRTWSTYAYMALWIGMSVNIPSWTLAAGLIALGMDWVQAVFTVMLGNVIVLVPMLLISHAGTKYGIPYPVFARAAFGVIGANLPALIRAGVACGWFGIQTWIGGGAIFFLLAAIFGEGSWWTTAGTLAIGFGDPQPWTLWLSFIIFWAINLAIVLKGMNTLRIFESWSAPFLIVISVALTVYMVMQAGGLGPILAQESGFGGWTGEFWAIFFPSLMAMIAFWSTLSLNMPDFTRFGRSQRDQTIGQALGLPTTMTVFAILAVFTASAATIVYAASSGVDVWNPVALVAEIGNPVVIIVALFAIALATLTTNVAANLVSPSYDFSNTFPKLISFRTGGIITAIISVLIQPWYLISNPEVYIFTWLGFYGGGTGAIAGVLIADYWWVRRTKLRLADLFRTDGGAYKYAAGWNWRALVALAVGIILAVGGAYTAPGTQGPFPADGLIPFLKPLYDYSWVVGLVAGFLVYAGLHMISPVTERGPAEEVTPSPEMA